MTMVAVLLNPPATDAVIVTVPGTEAAVNVAVAIPLEVVADAVIEPYMELLIVKLTVVPSATLEPRAVVINAWIEDVCVVVMVDGVAVIEILAASVVLAPVIKFHE